LDEVEAFVGQSTAQHSLAAATSGLSFAIKAALQQSIMPCMLHSPSPKCRGIPANVLPVSTSKRNKDASRFFMFATLYSKLIIAVNLARWFELGQTTRSLTVWFANFVPQGFVKYFRFARPNLRNFSRRP
jgi:hypothetical protein